LLPLSDSFRNEVLKIPVYVDSGKHIGPAFQGGEDCVYQEPESMFYDYRERSRSIQSIHGWLSEVGL
jgi:hypothetical protein